MCPITTIDIEDLVGWTYQVQCADMIVGAGVGLYESEALVDGVGRVFGGRGDSCARLRRAGLVGCVVDHSGGGRGDLHPDAETVHDAVQGLIRGDREAGLLVLQFGIAGLRPDWREGAYPRWEPCQTRQRPNGERVPVYDYHARYRGGRCPWICWIRMIDAPECIAFARRVYDDWRRGLVVLADVLGANRLRLSAHAVTGPAAPHRPWKAQETGVYEIGLDRLAGNR